MLPAKKNLRLPKLGENPKDFSDHTTTLEEREKGQEIERTETYFHEIADSFIAKYAGEVPEEDRERLSASVAAEVEGVFKSEQYSTKEEQVKALERLILQLRGDDEVSVAPAEDSPQEESTQDEESQRQESHEDVPADDQEDEQTKRKYKWHEYARMAIGLPSLAAWSLMNLKNKFTKSPDETEKNYKRRLNINTLATVAVGVAFGAWKGYSAYRGWSSMHGSSGIEDHIAQNHNGPNRSNNPWDADGNGIVDQHEYSIQSHHIEDQFINDNGRHGNDFNNIELHHNQDGSIDMNDLYGQFGEQFRKSPHELAAQFDQFHRLGTELPDDLKDLQYKPGETAEQYTERIADLLHGNRDLKDKAADFALDQLHGKSLEDLTRDYESNYIVTDGHGGWMIETDPDVTSADPNDRILVMGQANGYIEGVRIPCGQPIRIPIEVPQSAPQGVGAAAPADYSGQGGATNYQPVAPHVTPETTPGGQGNGGGSHGGNEGGQGGSSGGGNEGGDDKLAGKAGDFHADEGAPLASSGPLEGPAQTQTDSVFVDQRPGQAIPEGQTGSQAENAVQGTGGGRTEQATGNQGEGAAAADLNQSHESAEQEATTDPNATPEGAAGTETANPYQ